MRRPSAVAGSFYPANPDKLIDLIRECFTHSLGPGKLPENPFASSDTSLLGLVVPHAGYVYSGPVAAHAYYELSRRRVPRAIVIVGPNHTGLGTALSTMIEGVWETPLGEVEVDSEVAKFLVNECEYLDIDPSALLYEHSIEVQLPFMQFIYSRNPPPIVPIVMSLQSPEIARSLAKALISALRRWDLVIVASSDWTHYEPYEEARRKDSLALKCVEAVDGDCLFEAIEKFSISACGYGPVATLLYVAKELGCRAKVLSYATSGDVTGLKHSVVGYAAAAVYRC